jgi:uncharacterized membrane protein YfcA
MNLLLLGCILVLAHTAETVLGFGATLIALALGVHLVPLQELVPVLVILALLQSIWLVARWFRHIEWRILLRHILPAAGVGIPIGIWCRGVADENQLRMILGAFIVVVASAELVLLFRRQSVGDELRWYYRVPLVFAGGIFHGLFATGGPLIVYYASRQLREQATFRATLSTLWLVLNTVLLIGFWSGAQLDSEIFKMTAFVLPGLIVGIVLGSFIRVNELIFRGITYALLLLSGLVLLV